MEAISSREHSQFGTFRSQPGWVPRWEELRLDCFQRLEALVDSAGVDDIEEATALLRRFKGRSREVAAAIDEFMLDFMTLVFVVENGEAGFEKPVRKLARTRLSKLERLVTVMAEEKPASGAGLSL
ncbi:MAG: hypothetical protein EOS73_32760 [Mesorhizobium sp.]|nr:hypothetical protein EJ079_19590 [Mesorhizobium sp. M7A.F.Ce.TU.012.03.2.1]RVD12343.1 hypothetical protein EN749_27945 [Mesorhizobium sp. M7A.F.Ca.ET.027.02.1.1]RWC97285.1 MAG: hypothetical protein EOS73_32760 [Mesorhizobium sp.]RWO70295.1 MAG: hypothetical protein EOS17_11585 [Mesorhizobium sp.]RWP04679.1 MAG: hypothetical protein EOQ97_23585 [Mesorhizobium sp.]